MALMTHQQRVKNSLYLNWIRGALGLKYLQEGLYGIVDAQTKKQRKQLINRILVTSNQVSCSGATSICDRCTLENLLPEHAGLICIQRTKTKCLCKSQIGRRKCPYGICGRMYDLIVEEHAFREPFWQNTDPQLWYTDHWSIAKCFLTSLSHTGSAEDTDASGLLSIIANNLFVQKELAVTICPQTDSFSKAREARNEILHSPTQELHEVQMKLFIDTFIAVLQDSDNLVHDSSAQIAIKNLSQLKNCQIYISLSQIESAEADAIQLHALQSRTNAKRHSWN